MQTRLKSTQEFLGNRLEEKDKMIRELMLSKSKYKHLWEEMVNPEAAKRKKELRDEQMNAGIGQE